MHNNLPLSPVTHYIHNGEIKLNPWINKLVALEDYEQAKDSNYGLRISSDTEIDSIKPWFSLEHEPKAIAIHFETFRDGRGYSLARLIKRSPYAHVELIASGDITTEQAFYLWRCGFDSLIMRPDQDMILALNSLKHFSEVYQPAERQTFQAS